MAYLREVALRRQAELTYYANGVSLAMAEIERGHFAQAAQVNC